MDDHDAIREWLKEVPYKLLASELARRNSSRRRIAAGGRSKVLRSCTWCGQKFGTREMIAHLPSCSLRVPAQSRKKPCG